ncbi:MAG: DUF1343 domain-containing protein [Lentisphaerae bacterium]|nr:DUF1343 domain-containing protein [Lentisphaerota bacterium]
MKKAVKNGIDRISAAKRLLADNRIGLLTNASGLSKDMRPTSDILRERFNLAALYAPEHGIRGAKQAGGADEDHIDPETGLPVFDLTGAGGAENPRALDNIDMLVYDIQDVGARFYTYISCLSEMMSRCSARGIPIVVLDRVNPISGVRVEGEILDEAYSSVVGKHAIPTRYGLTPGEYARLINKEKNIGCELHVVELAGWRRGMYLDDTDLSWVSPSPNIPTVDTAIHYIGTCIFEATNISEGRGTTHPFSLIGAPFLDSRRLAGEMNSQRLGGVRFRRAYFTPMFSKHAGALCEGVELLVTDRNDYRPFDTGAILLRTIREMTPAFRLDEKLSCKLFGSDRLCRGAISEADFAQIEAAARGFAKNCAQYLLY